MHATVPYAMPDDDWDDDEVWYDDEESDAEEAARCPECGGPIHIITVKCPACGYWLTDGDQRTMRADMSRPRWLKVTAAVVLVAFLASILAAAINLF